MNPLLEWAVLAAAGLLAGVAGGLFGIGGGTILVPALVLVGLAAGRGADIVGLQAVATSLVAVGLLSLRAFRAHLRRGAGSIGAVLTMAPAGALGALLGAELALRIGGKGVLLAFAGLEISIALVLLLRRDNGREARTGPARRAGTGGWLLVGLVSGFVSSFLGVGGGIIAVPMQMLLLGVAPHTATANSSGLIIFNAVVGLIRYGNTGNAAVADGSLGLILPLAGVIMALAAMLAAPLGVRLAHALPPAGLRRAFGAFLLLVGILLILQVTGKG